MSPTYYADFETTQPSKKNQVSVYLWALVCGESIKTGKTLTEFMDTIKDMRAIIYFHNLRFDFSYIHKYLIENKIECEILENKGTYYSIKFWNIELRDTMNFFPNMSLKDVGKAYNTTYFKTSIEHLAEEGHVATAEEIQYCINDCLVLQEAYKTYIDTLINVLSEAGCVNTIKKIHKKLTNAAIAFEAFKELSDFDKLCPRTTHAQYNQLRPAYKGGYVYSNPCGIVKNVQMVDCNSIYPYIYANEPMPFGKGYVIKSEKDLYKYKFSIINVSMCYELKDGYIPIIGGGVGKFGGTIYKASSGGCWEEHTLCNIDIELIREFYDVEIIFKWGFGYNTKPEMFKTYCDTFLAVKNKEKGAKRNVAKVLLNSPYGKTAMNGLHEIKKYTLENNVVKSEIIGFEIQDDGYQYLPIAIAITAGARRLLLKTAQSIGFERVMYMDTDSIKFTEGAKPKIQIDPNILGAWKDEGKAQLFKTIAPKKYITWNVDGDKKLSITSAGFRKASVRETLFEQTAQSEFEDITYDKAFEMLKLFDKGLEVEVLQSKLLDGGRGLIKVKKEIK